MGWGGVECPVTKLTEMSGFDICRACVCERVRQTERICKAYSYEAVK